MQRFKKSRTALPLTLAALALCSAAHAEERRVSLFNNSFIPTSEASEGVSRRGMNITGSYLKSGKDQFATFDDWADVTQAQVESSLSSYLSGLSSTEFDDASDVFVMLDIEHPRDDVHPSNWYKYFKTDLSGDYLTTADGVKFEELVAGFITRIDAAQAEITNAQIGLFALPTPSTTGTINNAWQRRMIAYKKAADLGLFENVDFIAARGYFGGGASDDGSDAVQLASEGTNDLLDYIDTNSLGGTDGEPPLGMILFRLQREDDSTTPNTYYPEDISEVKDAICNLRSEDIPLIGFWAWDWDYSSGYSYADHGEYYSDLFQAGDFDFDGDVDSSDWSAYSTYYSAGSPQADIDDDGDVDYLDYALMADLYTNGDSTIISGYCP